MHKNFQFDSETLPKDLVLTGNAILEIVLYQRAENAENGL